MGIRTYVSNALIGFGRKLGRKAGAELVVELSEHDIKLGMVSPDDSERAWDDTLYKHGNVFVDGYANPIKPKVRHNKDLETPDTIDVEEGEETEVEDDTHVKLISSPRFGAFMRQKLISELLNPREQWRLIVYGIIALGVLGFVQIIVVLYATGAF